MALDSELIIDVATEMGVEASFIEKDYYATKVVQAIARCSHSEIKPIFCGGTSLSKGYGILRDFPKMWTFVHSSTSAQRQLNRFVETLGAKYAAWLNL